MSNEIFIKDYAESNPHIFDMQPEQVANEENNTGGNIITMEDVATIVNTYQIGKEFIKNSDNSASPDTYRYPLSTMEGATRKGVQTTVKFIANIFSLGMLGGLIDNLFNKLWKSTDMKLTKIVASLEPEWTPNPIVTQIKSENIHPLLDEQIRKTLKNQPSHIRGAYEKDNFIFYVKNRPISGYPYFDLYMAPYTKGQYNFDGIKVASLSRWFIFQYFIEKDVNSYANKISDTLGYLSNNFPSMVCPFIPAYDPDALIKWSASRRGGETNSTLLANDAFAYILSKDYASPIFNKNGLFMVKGGIKKIDVRGIEFELLKDNMTGQTITINSANVPNFGNKYFSGKSDNKKSLRSILLLGLGIYFTRKLF